MDGFMNYFLSVFVKEIMLNKNHDKNATASDQSSLSTWK